MADAADIFWAPRFKTGQPTGWPHSQEKTSSWTPQQIENVFNGLRKIPKKLWTKNALGFYRMRYAKDKENPAANGGGFIVLYDNLFNGKFKVAQVLSHELAHIHYDMEMSETDRQAYRDSMGWLEKRDLKGRNLIIMRREAGYIREQGKISSSEDFAVNMDAYLFEPDKLKRINLAAYNWMQAYLNDRLKQEK